MAAVTQPVTSTLPATAIPATPAATPSPLSQLNPTTSTIVSAGQAALNPSLYQTPASLNNPAQGNITSQNGVALTSVDPSQLAGSQLASLMSSNSPLNQLALAQGQAQAAATGNANGTLMAGASQTALDQQLTPIAQQQAAAYQQNAKDNQDAINQLQNTREQVGGETAAAGISANASMQNAKLAAQIQQQSLAQNQQQFTQNWANTFQQAQNSQAFQTATTQAQNEFNLKGSALSQAMSTIFSDPSYWSDPQSSMGMLNYFTTNIGSLIDNLGISNGQPQANSNIPNTAPSS